MKQTLAKLFRISFRYFFFTITNNLVTQTLNYYLQPDVKVFQMMFALCSMQAFSVRHTVCKIDKLFQYVT